MPLPDSQARSIFWLVPPPVRLCSRPRAAPVLLSPMPWVAVNAGHVVALVEMVDSTPPALRVVVSTGGHMDLPLDANSETGVRGVDPERFAEWMQGHADPAETFT